MDKREGAQSTHAKRALLTLVLCTSSLVIALRYSRQRETSNGERYISSTAVVMSESLKVAASIFLYYRTMKILAYNQLL